ncbi:uncharacterized protein ACNS7B_018041 isoform 2-T4 [Menidia menidia]
MADSHCNARTSIIAVSYEARAHGVTKNMWVDDAKKLCPDLQVARVRESRGKADLTHYRDASVEVIEVMSRFAVIERASIDEAYMDLTASVGQKLKNITDKQIEACLLKTTYIQGYPQTEPEPSANDGSSSGELTLDSDKEEQRARGLQQWLASLPSPSLGDQSSADLQLTVGALIVEEMRAAVEKHTGFQCSAGISHNKERTGPDDGLLGGPRESDLIKRVAVDGPEVKPSGSRYSKWVQLVHNQGHQQNQEEISIRTRTRNKPPSEPEETSIRTREKVLVTVPLTLLQRGLLHFHPPLPERKLKAIHSLGAGIIEKIALQFPTRFWDSKIQGADYFGHIPPAPEKRGLFSVFYDLDPQGKQAVLMSVISGDAVPAVCELEDQEVVGECLKVLRELFPEQDVPDPVNYFVTHWSKDRWSQMSYSFVKTGGSGEAYDVLAEDVQGKLFFAGEATNRHFPQTVTGAYLSGVREASKMAAV